MPFADALPQTCDILRVTGVTDDGLGKVPNDPLPHLNDVACRLFFERQRVQKDDLAQHAIITLEKMFVPAGTDVKHRDIIQNVRDSADVQTGDSFFVEEVQRHRELGAVHHITLVLKRKEHAA
jgi:hypothetical protein